MRIALTNWSNRLAGGAETYLGSIAHKLQTSGHEVSLWHERTEPAGRPLIPHTNGLETWDASLLGDALSLERLAQWEPDVIYCQGMLDPAHEAAAQRIAPSVFFAHNFHGTCISGSKTTALPVIQPCQRTFGPACLLRYLPMRCGGLNPVTMVREYRLNRERLEVLASYSQVITHSRWLTDEYRRHGIGCKQVRFFSALTPSAKLPSRNGAKEWNLLMMGRMVEAKGGTLLLDSLRHVAARSNKPIRLVMAGDGPSREAWQAQARSVMASEPAVEISFPGWLSSDQLEFQFASTDLLLMPSLWPEPFGMAGLEAAARGIPAVGFALGGIPDWLTDGVSGALVPADHLEARPFADAIVRCLAEDSHLTTLRQGAIESARRLTIAGHYEDLMNIFEFATNRVRLAIA